MKLRFNDMQQSQPDPFIFADGEHFYLYATGKDGVTVFESKTLADEWLYRGIATDFENASEFWAPSVIRLEGKYYMYVSCISEAGHQFMHVAVSDAPIGPFKKVACLYDHFSIDSHMVKTDAGLFLFYAKNNVDCDLVGTRIYIDRFLDPVTPEYNPKEVLLPSFPEEKYSSTTPPKGDWYTLEGPFWFREGDWQYLMYSGGRYKNDTYHLGYAVAKTDEQDLKKVDFVKVTDHGRFSPLLIKNDFEEGTGHNSVIKYQNEYYIFYHARDYQDQLEQEYVERRTARICRMTVRDGVLTAERFEDRL